MTDRELLELAAKAVGYKWREDIAEERDKLGLISLWIVDPMKTAWNPLDSDGDALRLAVKLNLHIQIDFDAADVNQLVYVYGNWRGQGIDEPPGDDPYAATRLAIVRAAAEIGKRMK
jgi:hypothetical protein